MVTRRRLSLQFSTNVDGHKHIHILIPYKNAHTHTQNLRLKIPKKTNKAVDPEILPHYQQAHMPIMGRITDKSRDYVLLSMGTSPIIGEIMSLNHVISS